MGLLKAADAEFVVLEEDNEQDLLSVGEENISLYEKPEYEMAAPIIIGGDGLIDVQAISFSDSMDNLVFFAGADTEVTFGEPVLVGGAVIILLVRTPLKMPTNTLMTTTLKQTIQKMTPMMSMIKQQR